MDTTGEAVPLEAALQQWNFFPWVPCLSLYAILLLADCVSVFSVVHHFTGDTISSWLGHQYPAFPLGEKQDATTVALRIVVADLYFYGWFMALIKPLISASLWFQSGHTRKKYVFLAVLSITQIAMSVMGLTLRNVIFSIPLDEDAVVETTLTRLLESWQVQRYCDPEKGFGQIGPAHQFGNQLIDIVNVVLAAFRVVGLNFQTWTHRGIRPLLDAGLDPPRACIKALYQQLVRATDFWSVLFPACSVIEGLIQMAFIAFHNRGRHIPDHYEPVVLQGGVDTRTCLNFENQSTSPESEEGQIARIFAEQERLWLAPRVRKETTGHETTIKPPIPKTRSTGTGPQFDPTIQYWGLAKFPSIVKLMISFFSIIWVCSTHWAITPGALLLTLYGRYPWETFELLSTFAFPGIMTVYAAFVILTIRMKIPLSQKFMRLVRIDTLYVALLTTLNIIWVLKESYTASYAYQFIRNWSFHPYLWLGAFYFGFTALYMVRPMMGRMFPTRGAARPSMVETVGMLSVTHVVLLPVCLVERFELIESRSEPCWGLGYPGRVKCREWYANSRDLCPAVNIPDDVCPNFVYFARLFGLLLEPGSRIYG